MSDIVEKWFLEHPRSVHETYLEHQRAAGGFAVKLFGAACQCLLHAFVPHLFERSASTTVERLYKDMVTHRVRQPAPARNGPESGPMADGTTF